MSEPAKINNDDNENEKKVTSATEESTNNQNEQSLVIEGETGEDDDTEYYVVVEGDDNGEGDDFSGVQLVQVDESDASETVLLDQGRSGVISRKSDDDGAHFIVTDDTIQEESVVHTTAIAGTQQGRTVIAQVEDGTYQVVQLMEDEPTVHTGSQVDDTDPLSVGAMATAMSGDEEFVQILEPIPQGMKGRRSRVFGTCRCPECGQSFINSARLERHLAVHQVFGSYLCPLCGKTYKYEYNLFYHWRRTCRDLNELMAVEERKSMDVNALRQLVDEVASKKAEMGADARRRVHYDTEPQPRLEIPAGRRGEPCHECGVVVMGAHLNRHLMIHRGEAPADGRSAAGGYYCDLCGLMFRAHFNLIKHWRTSCPEIQSQVDPEVELTMDDGSVKELVEELLQKKRSSNDDVQVIRQEMFDAEVEPSTSVATKEGEVGESDGDGETLETPPDLDAEEGEMEPIAESLKRPILSASGIKGLKPRLLEEEEVDVTTVEERRRSAINRSVEVDIDDPWSDERFLEDEFLDAADEYAALIRHPNEPIEIGPLGLPQPLNRAKWSSLGGPVQCPECFRSFANAGRLERHLTGFHQSYGTHHCILCGNRFKYDYNLLYHYRHSCPYTKAFIDRDVREQMDAQSLRKLVKNLAQKEVRLAPQVQPPPKLPGKSEVPRPRLAMRYPSNQPPAHLLLPRPGMPQGKTCPVCGVIFYGKLSIQRHIEATHPEDFECWQSAGGESALPAPMEIPLDEEPLEPTSVSTISSLPKVIHRPPPKIRAPVLRSPKVHGRLARAGARILSPAKPLSAKERANIDPRLETSIANFLSEMKEEAGKQSDDGLETERPEITVKRKRKNHASAIKVQVESEHVVIDDVQFENVVQLTENDAEEPVYTAQFEEELDVDPEPITTVQSDPPVKRRRGRPPKTSDQRQTRSVKFTEPELPNCAQCGKRFITNAHLTKHLRQYHGAPTQLEPVECTLCNLNFRQYSNLLSHWRTVSCMKLKEIGKTRKELKALSDDDLKDFVAKIESDFVEEEETKPSTSIRKSTRMRSKV